MKAKSQGSLSTTTKPKFDNKIGLKTLNSIISLNFLGNQRERERERWNQNHKEITKDNSKYKKQKIKTSLTTKKPNLAGQQTPSRTGNDTYTLGVQQ
jgi:hypothetical protein